MGSPEGMTITGFEGRGYAAAHVSVEAVPMWLGRFPSGTDEAVERLADLLLAAGIHAEMTDVIRSNIRYKTLYNCAPNSPGAIMNVPYGAFFDPHARAFIAGIVGEVYRVAEAGDVTLSPATLEVYPEHLKTARLPATAAHHHSSMLRNLTRGRDIEIDLMNGAVAALARRHGIDALYDDCLAKLIRFRETALMVG